MPPSLSKWFSSKETSELSIFFKCLHYWRERVRLSLIAPAILMKIWEYGLSSTQELTGNDFAAPLQSSWQDIAQQSFPPELQGSHLLYRAASSGSHGRLPKKWELELLQQYSLPQTDYSEPKLENIHQDDFYYARTINVLKYFTNIISKYNCYYEIC